MKITKCLMVVLFCLSLFCLSACFGKQKSHVEKAIADELNPLKNLDSETAQKYVSYTEIFPDVKKSSDQPEEIQEVFSLFFHDFDYKILKIDVDTKANKANAKLRLKTPDTAALAKDYARALLKYSILAAADSESESTNDVLPSIEARYLLLNQQLTENTYETVDTDCIVQLTRADKKSDTWEIKRTPTFENDLIGGLMTALTQNDILSPEETLQIYLNTLEKMNLKQMSNYLGISSLLQSNDAQKEELAEALVEQVHTNFKYEIADSNIIDSYTAEVKALITSFDSEKIFSAYQEELEKYLASPEAVIDGSSVRLQKAYDMLLNHIKNSDSSTEHEVIFHLINDGISWKLSDGNEELGTAIFGSLTEASVEE